jgi:RNA polymerase sigma factor (sigma-70 family)
VQTDATLATMDTDATILCGTCEPEEHIDPQEPEPGLAGENLYAAYRACRNAGDTQAARKLQWEIALNNENLIWWWARKQWHRWRPYSMSVQDLAHYGMFGMLRAIEKFQPSFETKLSSYAGWWIRRSIDSAVFENGQTIRIPEYRINQKAQIDAVTLELLERGQEPSIDNIARELNTREDIRCRERPERKRKLWTAEAVDEVNLSTLQMFSSLDQGAYSDSSEELHSYMVSAPETPDSPARAAPLLREGFSAIVDAAELSDRDRLILELYFYAESRDKATVARLFGITKKTFGALLGSFLEDFPELFKLANAQDSDFLSIIRFAHLPERHRNIMRDHYAGDAEKQAPCPGRDTNSHTVHQITTRFEQEYSDLHAVLRKRPALMHSLLQFAQWPADHRMMLGVFFCRGDLKKQDIAVLCNVSRERVRQIIDDFSRRHRGPLSRLFMNDFESAQELCEKYIRQRFKAVEKTIDTWLKKSKLSKSAAFFKMIYIERLPRKTIAERCGGLRPGTMTNRLQRAAERLRTAPADVLPFFCNGIVGFSPREILARQTWGFLPHAAQEQFLRTLDSDEKKIFSARLALDDRQHTLRELSEILDKKHASDIAGIIDQILHNFFDAAAEHIQQST